MNVLFLTPWYPTESDAMAGLFVQKHVEAVRAQGVEVRVLHSQTWRELWAAWRSLHKDGWMPDVVQLNVMQKQGLLALWLKRHYGIPFVIIEHWSGYLLENRHKLSASRIRFAQRLCAEAQTVMTVSPLLQEGLQAIGCKAKRWERIGNVVDDFFFDQRLTTNDKRQKTILHVSCFDEQAKNTSALLRGFKALCDRRTNVQLVMVGTGVDWQASHDLADELDIPADNILWTGEQTPEQVCEWMHNADALVLTSRYETAGIVLCEAAACGLPILSTPVGLATEIVTEETGIIVSQENVNRPKRLSEYMEAVISMPKFPSRAQEYKADTIGRQLKDIYAQCTVSE